MTCLLGPIKGVFEHVHIALPHQSHKTPQHCKKKGTALRRGDPIAPYDNIYSKTHLKVNRAAVVTK